MLLTNVVKKSFGMQAVVLIGRFRVVDLICRYLMIDL